MHDASSVCACDQIKHRLWYSTMKMTEQWKMNIEIAKKFADYFEYWWKPQWYEMWMVCARGIARDSMDTNNLNRKN